MKRASSSAGHPIATAAAPPSTPQQLRGSLGSTHAPAAGSRARTHVHSHTQHTRTRQHSTPVAGVVRSALSTPVPTSVHAPTPPATYLPPLAALPCQHAENQKLAELMFNPVVEADKKKAVVAKISKEAGFQK